MTYEQYHEEITEEQRKALRTLYLQNRDGSDTFPEFLTRAHLPTKINSHVGITWCGMYVGIEPDGYTHT